ncbi:MAG: 16S rRNA (cytosine(1402)-N(4))-methyltransferase RsmH [Lachnospirales bacterium]
MNFNHISVLLYESINSLNINKNGVYVDGTMGGAGHSLEIAKKLTTGKLICIDQDLNAHAKGREVLKEYLDKTFFVHDNFSNLKSILYKLNIDKIDGMLLDLGVSSHQLDEKDRGFSYHQNAILDMRMNKENNINAKYIVNNYSENDLSGIILKYGEERWAKRIAKFIVEERETTEINTTDDLVRIIKKAIPKKARENSHPAKKTFQALRIEVNNELNILENTIDVCVESLNKGGRMSIITFHSLEDRIIKQKFNTLANPCICPREFPICMCKKEAKIKIINRKPIVPTNEEIENNRRSRSSKLRVLEKI